MLRVDASLAFLDGLLKSFLDGFGKAYDVLPLVVLEQLQCCTPV